MSKRVILSDEDIRLILRLMDGVEAEISALRNGKIYVISTQRLNQLKAKLAPKQEADKKGASNADQ